MPEQHRKQPREEIDFDFDATRRLAPDETLVSAIVTYTGTDGMLVLVGQPTVTDTRAKVWTKAGTDGGVYKLTCLATTSGGRKLESEFILLVKDT